MWMIFVEVVEDTFWERRLFEDVILIRIMENPPFLYSSHGEMVFASSGTRLTIDPAD